MVCPAPFVAEASSPNELVVPFGSVRVRVFPAAS
jgi:hypothetical protein